MDRSGSLLCVAVAWRRIGAAQIVTGWLPGTPGVDLGRPVHGGLLGTNLAAVKNFGEFEFWFAALKVGAITLFLVLGVLAILGVLPGTDSPGTSQPHRRRRLHAQRLEGLIVGLLASVFAYGGLETVTIAAAESEDPVRGVAKAVRTAMWRIAVFYVGSMAVIVTLCRGTTPRSPRSARTSRCSTTSASRRPADHERGHPGRPALRDERQHLRLLAHGRTPWSPAARARRSLGKVTGGVPRAPCCVSSVFGFLCVLLSYWWPGHVFPWLLNMIGAVILVVWVFIAVSQLRDAPHGWSARPRRSSS